MNRKDYELLASALRQSRPQNYDFLIKFDFELAKTQWQKSVVNIALHLNSDNLNFKVNKFVSLCTKGWEPYDKFGVDEDDIPF